MKERETRITDKEIRALKKIRNMEVLRCQGRLITEEDFFEAEEKLWEAVEERIDKDIERGDCCVQGE